MGLEEVHELLTKGAGLEEVLHRVASNLGPALDASRVVVWRKGDAEPIEVAGTGPPSDARLRQAASEGRTCTSAGYLEELPEEQPIEWLSAPARSRGKVLAVVGVGWDPPRPLSKDGRDLLWSLAGLVGIAVENAQLLVRLHEKEQSLQGLLRKTLTAQEEERRRIARELHDETSQVLSALLMNIGLLEGHVAENGSSKARVEAVKALAAEAARNLDTMLFELRPALLDELGLVYVADMGNQIVQTYTISGEHVGSLPDTGQDRDVFGPDGFTPYDVQVANGRIVVSSSDGLYFFDDDGAVVARWGGSADGRNIRGPGEGMFNFPDSFVHDPQTGWFFVADTGNRRVIAIDENGFRKWVSGTPDVEGKVTSFWQLPRSIELGSDGNLYVVDTFRFDPEGMGTGHIVVLSKEGELLSEFGRAGETDGAFDFPDQIAAGPDGLIALADRENDRVVVFRVGTSLPAVDDLLSRRYPEGFDTPEYVWVTPPPTPPIETRQG